MTDDKPKRGHAGRQLLLSLFLIGTAGTALGVGSFAAWTASTTNPNNAFATGSLHMTNSDAAGCTDLVAGPCTAILTATNMKPGGTAVTGTVTITNTGTLAGSYSLSATGVAAVCSHMDLTITDEFPHTVYTGTIAGLVTTGATLAVDNPFAATNGTHTYTFSVSLDVASPSSEEGSTCTAGFTWTAVPN